MPTSEERELALKWSGRLSLTSRILAVNIFALAILAGSLFYLDSFRSRLTAARLEQARTEARIVAAALNAARPGTRGDLLRRLGRDSGARLQVYSSAGALRMDSWNSSPPTYVIPDPLRQPWQEQAARILDTGFDAIMGSPRAPPLRDASSDRLADWPEAQAALRTGATVMMLRRAPDGVPFVSAAAPTRLEEPSVLLLTASARDVTDIVRNERLTLSIILAGTIVLSVLLSHFLARTIALPLRRLARAAQRVRLGRAREVDVPRLPARRDEIGLLARALHDMTQSLRSRIDSTEAFAADVTHELKNPLASLRSAVDALQSVEDPSLRRQLLDVVREDVVRLDRLIVDIAEISRLDAELSRTRFEPVDMGELVRSLLELWNTRAAQRRVRIHTVVPRDGAATVLGDEARLARALDNIVDNAISFSPTGGLVTVVVTRERDETVTAVEDDGPGVREQAREAIFNRFHSMRPDDEAFGRHSGLGLAIAKAIVEGHDGRIGVEDRQDGRNGARFVVRMPGATI